MIATSPRAASAVPATQELLPEIPDHIWEDPGIHPNDLWLYGWVVRWRRLHPRVPLTQRQISIAMKKSASVVSRTATRLRAGGWFAPGRELVPIVPEPRRAPPPPDTAQRMLPGFNELDASVKENATERCSGATNRCTAEQPAVPHTPLSISKEEEKLTDSVTENDSKVSQSVSFSSGDQKGIEETERIPELVKRGCDMFGNATPGKIRLAIRNSGVEAVEYALDVSEQKMPPPDSVGYLFGILKKIRIEGFKKPKPDLKVYPEKKKSDSPTQLGRCLPTPAPDGPRGEELWQILGIRRPASAAQKHRLPGHSAKPPAAGWRSVPLSPGLYRRRKPTAKPGVSGT